MLSPSPIEFKLEDGKHAVNLDYQLILTDRRTFRGSCSFAINLLGNALYQQWIEFPQGIGENYFECHYRKQ